MSQETFRPAKYVQDSEKAHDMAHAVDALRTNAARRRLAVKAIDKMVSLGANDSEIYSTLNSQKRENNPDAKPDSQMPEAAHMALDRAYRYIGPEGGAPLSASEINYHMANEQRLLDNQADDLEDEIAESYDTKDTHVA